MCKKPARPLNALRIAALTKKLQTARSTILDWLNPESPRYDPTFPRPIKLGKSVTVWIEGMIDDWLEAKMVDAMEEVSLDLLAASNATEIHNYTR